MTAFSYSSIIRKSAKIAGNRAKIAYNDIIIEKLRNLKTARITLHNRTNTIY